MTDSVSDVSTSRTGRIAPVWLILICVGALTFYLFMLRSWQLPDDAASVAAASGDSAAQLEMSRRLTQPGIGAAKSTITPAQRSLLLPLAGFTLAMGAGICLGLWWPSRAERSVDTPDLDEPLIVVDDSGSDVTIPMRRNSALVEEEHIVGKQPQQRPPQVSEPPAEYDDTLEHVAISSPIDHNDVPDLAQADTERDDDVIGDMLGTDTRDNEDAADTTAASDEDSQAFESTLAARDQLIESLEDIVKENRDRWSDFEAQRDALREKIDKLEGELRIANDIIDGARGTSDDEPIERPQVLNRA